MLWLMAKAESEERKGETRPQSPDRPDRPDHPGRVVAPDYYSRVYSRIYKYLGRFYDPFVRSALFFMNGGSGGERRWREDTVDFLDPLPGERIVDLCSGTGTLTIMIADRLGGRGEVVGIEVSETQLRVARSKRIPPVLTFVHGNAARTTFPEGRFDKAVICAALHEMLRETRDDILGEALRLLRPGGRLVSVEHREPVERRKAFLINAFEYLTPEYPTYRDLLDSGLQNEVEAAGFTTIDTGITASGYFQMILAEKPY
jgi:demethylmenaquinone methyltransferase/2-methoxy-6-polyprenyl-1,4-benzoquinol methylase